MRSRPKSRFTWIAAAAACFALAVAAMPVAAKSPVKVVLLAPGGDEAAAPMLPKARFSAKIESCVESTMYASRQVGLYASMRPYKSTTRMQMRFRLLRMYYNGGGYKPVSGLGLDEWTSVSPKAYAAIRHLVVSGVDTDAVYMGRVDFRWRARKGGWKTRRTAYTRQRCQQTTPAPDLQIAGFRIVSTIGPVSTYQLDLVNNGGSEARSVNLELSIDGKSAAKRSIASMAAGATAGYQVTADTCTSTAVLVLDPGKLVHESSEDNNAASLTCR